MKDQPAQDFPHSPLLKNPDQVKEILASAETEPLVPGAVPAGGAGREQTPAPDLDPGRDPEAPRTEIPTPKAPPGPPRRTCGRKCGSHPGKALVPASPRPTLVDKLTKCTWHISPIDNGYRDVYCLLRPFPATVCRCGNQNVLRQTVIRHEDLFDVRPLRKVSPKFPWLRFTMLTLRALRSYLPLGILIVVISSGHLLATSAVGLVSRFRKVPQEELKMTSDPNAPGAPPSFCIGKFSGTIAGKPAVKMTTFASRFSPKPDGNLRTSKSLTTIRVGTSLAFMRAPSSPMGQSRNLTGKLPRNCGERTGGEDKGQDLFASGCSNRLCHRVLLHDVL